LQHLLVHSHQNLLFRSHPFPCSPPPSLPPLSFPCSHHPTLLPSFSLHLLPVHLPVLRQRQLLYLHILARHHISRHLLPQLTPHLLHFQLSPSLLPHHIPHQPLVLPSTLSFSLFHQHHRLLHPLALLQRSFDLLQLDPISTDFYLLILPPQILQLPLSPPPHLVPRPIQPPSSSSFPSYKRVRHKPFRRQLRPVLIPSRHSLPPHIQLSLHSHRHRLHLLVQHIRLRVPDRLPDRDAPTSLQLLLPHLMA